MKKMVFSLFLICMAVCAVRGQVQDVYSTPAAVVENISSPIPYDACIDGIFYNLDAVTNKAEVTCPYYGVYSGAVVVPAAVDYQGTTYSVASIGERAFYACNELKAVTMPSSLTAIGIEAFLRCNALADITIPDNVTSIGAAAFYGTGIVSITIPASVTSIGEGVCGNCSSLESITIADGNAVYDSRDNCNAIICTADNSLLQGCKETVIPTSVTTIGNMAFYACTNLASMTIPNGVTTIGDYAFSDCYRLKNIEIPGSVTAIGERAFTGCNAESITVAVYNPVYDSRDNCNAIISTANNSLVKGCKNTVIPNGVASIGDYAFQGCDGLTSINIPGSVTAIGNYAFESCFDLTAVYCNVVDVIPIGSETFKYIDALATLYVPTGTKDNYSSTPYWNNFYSIVEYDPTAIDHATAGSSIAVNGRYGLDGRKVAARQRGLTIVRQSDGMVKKVLVK